MLSLEVPRWISATLALCLLPKTINLSIYYVASINDVFRRRDNWLNLSVAVNFMLLITCCFQLSGAFILNKEFHKMTIILFLLFCGSTAICNIVLRSHNMDGWIKYMQHYEEWCEKHPYDPECS